MKNKSSRHKEANTFKFQPFSERISNIDVDIFHRVAHVYETQHDEEDACQFSQAVDKWNVLNLTEGYDAFKKEVRAYSIITLPQLLHSKDKIVEVLRKHLSNKNPLCLQPLLEFIVALAKDLRNDFYQYYPDFLSILLDLLVTKDSEQLEWTFTCLAYLFKFLWRSMIKDVSTVFNALLPLLSDSRPQYINSFAAESFAFVARKVKDQRGFLNLILKSVRNQQDGVSGCGRLIFEVLNGVNGQFHSCADTILPFLLESLSDEKLPQSELFEILEQIIANIVENIQPSKSDLLWNTFVSTLNKLREDWINGKDEKIASNIDLLLKLVGQAIEYKNGRLLQNTTQLTQTLIKLFSVNDITENVLLNAAKISILLLILKGVKLSQEEASGLNRKILLLPQKPVLLYFVDNVSAYPSFEAMILPTFLQHCNESNLEHDCFKVLTQLILKKSPLSEDGIKLCEWNKYQIDFGSNTEKIKLILQKHIEVEIDYSNLDLYLCSLICIPHLNLSNVKQLQSRLKQNLNKICGHINAAFEAQGKLDQKLFLLCNVLECLVHISNDVDLVDIQDVLITTLLPLCNNIKFVVALKILDLFFTTISKLASALNVACLQQLHGVMEDNFNAPYHCMRLLTTHIYSLFEETIDLTPNASTESWNIFTICYRVESISPLVHTYRDQLQQLEKLNFDKPQINMCKDSEFNTIPIRYLCGVLYMNFQLLWEPVIDIISSHAHGFDMNIFWKIFCEQLKNADGNIKTEIELKHVLLECNFEFIRDLFQAMCKIDDKPDFVNYRIMLWKAMALFSDVAESKTRDVSEFLLRFIEDEYMKSNSDVALMWNIKENSTDVLEETMDVDETLPEGEDETERIKKELTKPVAKGGGKNNLKTLLQYLAVFSKIRSPKSMYRESELYKLYFDLLSHKNPKVQKIALDCIMTYKFKYLTPYQQNVYNLIDDKNFKTELAIFRVDKETSVIQPEHREDLLPIIMRIVFSKMVAKTGLRTGGKSTGQMRRNLVLRFLAGCKENEMLTFIHMAFRYYEKYLCDDVEEMIATITNNVDLEKFIPPKRLQSTVNLLTIVLEQFGNLMGTDLLKFLLKILLTIGASLKGAYFQQTKIHIGYVSTLRTLRTSCIKIAERFFEHFETYPWTAQEIDAVFEVFVWPYLDKLNIEGIHSPTTLLKLLCLWGTNPRYFGLLVKHEQGNENQYALPHIMELLLNRKSHYSVTHLIMEMVDKLLSLTADEEDLQIPIPINNALAIQKDILDRLKINDKLNYGSCILLPHVPSVLEKIKRKLESKAKNINQKELFILSRISELVWEAETSDTILRLLLPIIHKKCTLGAGEEIILRLVTTVYNLIQNVHTPEEHLKQISPLFAQIAYASSRKILCQILTTISAKCNSALSDNLITTKNLIIELNAFDAKWLDQPDFQRRLDAFRKIQSMVDENTLTLELGILIIFDCYYLISSEKDLSLRESATHCLKSVAPNLIKKCEHNTKDKNYIIDDTLLALIRNGLRNKNDDIRNECISLLGHLCRECPESHSVLRDLNKLTNKKDMEVDFFENLTHLQTHRQGRALIKFTQIYKEQTVAPNIRSLTQFMLPLITHYLCTDKFTNKHSLVDGAIEAVGTVCRLLPWHQYEGLLKYYLGKLRNKVDYQRQLVRLTVAILDAFHFDLTKGHVEAIQVVKNKVEDMVVEEVVLEIEDGTKVTDADEEIVDQDADNTILEEVEKELDEVLDEEAELQVLEDEIEESVEVIKVYDKTTVLCKSTATRVTRTIQTILLPQLHKTLAIMTTHETSHKVNRKRTGAEREEEDLLRVPISLAVVKLLQRLPKVILDANLPGVFMKLCTFLKSQLDSVRRTAREILQKIMITLGPTYLGVLLSEMAPLLSRGFEVHVLVYTIHAVLVTLKDMYKPTDIDNVLLTILKVCKADLFGSLSEEKEVAKIVSKTSEAKATKSLDTFQILAQYITDKCLMDLILPIKSILAYSQSFKVVHKAQDCLRHIALGLVDNAFMEIDSLLKFAYGTASESIPQLITKDKAVMSEKEREKMSRQKESCLIIPKLLVGRSGYRSNNAKSSAKANAHLLVEFGLRLCNFMLKRDKLKNGDYRPFIDPFVEVFKNCLTSKHVKLSTVTLQCLQWVMKYDLPSMRDNIKEITESLFGILHKYASSGLSKGDNFDLVVAAFKTMSVLVRDVKYHTIETDQLKILLLYVEQDLYDHDRQATAFSLLKAILARKLIVPEIHEIMSKVSELSITSELVHVRVQARIVFHQYLMDYPLGKKMDTHIAFYTSQMNYEIQSGRESALEMIESLIHSFPYNMLKAHSGALFITLGARLVNDDVPECRKMVANSLTAMLTKLTKPDRDPLFDILLLWLKDKKITHKHLASQLCGILITVEKYQFETRMETLIPLILLQFGLNDEEQQPGRFVLLKREDAVESDEKERVKDHHLFQVLQMLLKLCTHCPNFLKRTNDIENLSAHIQTLLGYPHEWVRLSAAQFLGFVLNSLDIEKLCTLLASNEKLETGYLYTDPVNCVRNLTLDLCGQLQPGSIKTDLAEQVIKNLVFIARVLQKVPLTKATTDNDTEKRINLLWLVKRMRRIVNTEVVEDASTIVLRTEVFKWIAGIITALDIEIIKPLLHHLLAPLVREMITTEEVNAPLRQLSKEVGHLIKKRIGMEEYTAQLSKLQQQLSVKRAERKRGRAQLAVTDPEMFAKKKIKANEKKKEAKKKKVGKIKGNYKGKRKGVDLER